MSVIKSILAKAFARRVHSKVQKWANNPLVTQEKVFKHWETKIL